MTEPETPDLRHDGPDDGPTLALAHGAGAGMDHPFLETVATGLAARGVHVVRFEFPYMARRRVTGKKGGPDRAPVLEAAWRKVIAALGNPASLVIGGKSMGGRIASRVADEAGVAGLVCLGYPFHPPGKPEKLRTAHLATLATPALIVQGSRDPFGRREEVEGYALSDAIELRFLDDGDHSFKPRKRSGHTEEAHLAAAVEAVAAFVHRVAG